jgi:hypothetical protein
MASVADLNSLYNDSFLPIYNNRDNMQIWVRGLANPEELTEVEREIFFLFMMRLLNTFDTAVTQYLGGTLESHQFERYRAFNEGLVGTPGGGVFLAATPAQLTADARRLLGLDDG